MLNAIQEIGCGTCSHGRTDLSGHIEGRQKQMGILKTINEIDRGPCRPECHARAWRIEGRAREQAF